MPRTIAPHRPHPLAAVGDQIDLQAVYTVSQIAALLDISRSSVWLMVQHGWLPGASRRSIGTGGFEYVWTGRRLQRIALAPLRLRFDAADHERYSPVTLYRVGCRCTVCTKAHVVESRARNRALSDEAFPAAARARLLDLVAGGEPVATAAPMVDAAPGLVYGRAQWDAQFGAALDEAAWGLCHHRTSSPQTACSTATAYRNGCRGTGCREWRRAASRQERDGAAR